MSANKNIFRFFRLTSLLVSMLVTPFSNTTKPISAFASNAEQNNTEGIYFGYSGAPSENWYREDLPVSSSPMITVLVHGLGSEASAWSNNYYRGISGENMKLAYDSTSLIEQLRVNSPDQNGATVYLAKMETDSTFKLSELLTLGQLTVYPDSLPTIARLPKEALKKHIIIVFEVSKNNTGNSNSAVYGELKTMLNRIVRDVAYLTGGIYPMINMIGHSRGGVTNLTYAMDYPQLIHSIYSLGTPYFGSNFGRINAFSNMMDMYGNPGFNDIQNNNPVDDGKTTLVEKWNNGINSGRYSHINVHAFAGDSTIRFYEQMNNAGYFGEHSEDVSNLIKESKRLDGGLSDLLARNKIKYGIHKIEDEEGLPRTPSSTIDRVLKNIKSPRMNDDIFVSLNSQHGIRGGTGENNRFLNFEYHTRYYENLADASLTKVSENAPPAVHNLEARDPEIIEEIVSLIQLGTLEPFTTRPIGTSTIAITGVKPTLLLSGHLVIPATLNGKTVTLIDSLAFSGQNQLSRITIPSTITTIRSEAFKDTNNARIYLENRTSSPSSFSANWNVSNNPVYLNNVLCKHMSRTPIRLNSVHHREMCDLCRSTVKVSSHSLTKYIWENYNQHANTCDCGYSELQGHVISSDGRGFPYKNCLLCGGPANYGFVRHGGQIPIIDLIPTNFIQEYFGDGSYLMVNGIYVISTKDLDKFYAGKLALPNPIIRINDEPSTVTHFNCC